MSRFWEIVFCVALLFRRRVCLSYLKHARSPELPLTARKTVFSHLKQWKNCGMLASEGTCSHGFTRISVTVLGATSRDLPVTSGVPQGSILGPALFLLYVNNLPDSILNSKVAMFADDTKVYKVVMSEDDGAALQQDLDNLSSWSAASGLAFNDKKCKLQTITRKRKPICTSYEVNGSTIKSCEVERDLGVSLDCDLTWHAQVSHQAARANKLLGFSCSKGG